MTTNGQKTIAVESDKLARALPFSLVESIAASINSSTLDLAATKTRLLKDISHAEYRGVVAHFMNRWTLEASDVTAPAVSLALLTAAQAEKADRDESSIELVWTGPESDAAPFRRTEQAIRQILDSAVQKITIVSYAVYRIPFICEALIRAAKRGVRITVIVETPDHTAGKQEYDTLIALGDEVAACSSVLYWPRENRPKNDVGKTGILHVKCAVADSQWLFLSSANLTQYAFTINMELGVLIRGGRLPNLIERHFCLLQDTGVLVPCTDSH